MNRDELELALDRWGADLRHWPPADAARARALLTADPAVDIVIHLGDYIYEYGEDGALLAVDEGVDRHGTTEEVALHPVAAGRAQEQRLGFVLHALRSDPHAQRTSLGFAGRFIRHQKSVQTPQHLPPAASVLVAGILIASAGTAYVFAVNFLLALACAVALFLWKRPQKPPSVLPGERFIGATVWKTP